MEDLLEREDPVRAGRRRLGIRVGILGLLLLFGSAISLLFVPTGWEIVVLGLIAAGAGILVVALLLVR